MPAKAGAHNPPVVGASKERPPIQHQESKHFAFSSQRTSSYHCTQANLPENPTGMKNENIKYLLSLQPHTYGSKTVQESRISGFYANLSSNGPYKLAG